MLWAIVGDVVFRVLRLLRLFNGGLGIIGSASDNDGDERQAYNSRELSNKKTRRAQYGRRV